MTTWASDVSHRQDLDEVRRKDRERQAAKRLARGGRPRHSIWSRDELVLMKQLRDQGLRPLAMHPHFPGKTYEQISNKSRHMIRPEYVNYKALGLGLGLGCGPVPTFEQLEDRAAIQAAELDESHYRNPNVILLGDPSPTRVAIARRLQADPVPKPFSISAVKVKAERDPDEEYSHQKGASLRCGLLG